MKLLAHLIYLLNEQGVGNTFYLSPIIKKILDNHYEQERKAKLSTMKVYIRKFTNNGYLNYYNFKDLEITIKILVYKGLYIINLLLYLHYKIIKLIMNSDLKITLSRVLEKPLQINGTDTETHYINELFKRLVFHELLNKLNLKSLYHYRDNVKYCPGKVELNFTLNKQELDLLINQITSMDNVQKTYIILQPWLQDLNKGEQEELIQLLIKNYGRNI